MTSYRAAFSFRLTLTAVLAVQAAAYGQEDARAAATDALQTELRDRVLPTLDTYCAACHLAARSSRRNPQSCHRFLVVCPSSTG